jgi:hypothetical protein
LKNLKKRGYLEDTDVEHKEIECEGLNWIYVAQERGPIIISLECSNEHLGS